MRSISDYSLYFNYMTNLPQRVFAPFLTFIALFIGTGFVSGSIVHMGEGINSWDLSLLGIGVVLFVAGSVIQDVQQGMRRIKEGGIIMFLLLSLLLSIGIGMASGGMQHFVDTPAYSAVLIPLGLALGFGAFIFKERIALTTKEWLLVLPGTLAVAVAVAVALRATAGALPESLLQDHAHMPAPTMETTSSSASSHAVDGHDH
jgi:O-antigen/teichoic acid export membrane protein